MKTMIYALLAILASSTTALAAGSAESDGNGFLVTLFLAFGALIIVFQLVPGLLLFGSMIKGLFIKPAPGKAKSDRAA